MTKASAWHQSKHDREVSQHDREVMRGHLTDLDLALLIRLCFDRKIFQNMSFSETGRNIFQKLIEMFSESDVNISQKLARRKEISFEN